MSETDFDRKGENSSYQESTGGGGWKFIKDNKR